MSEINANNDKNDNLQSVNNQQVKSIPVKTARHCPKCGEQINLKAEICPRCGVRVSPPPYRTRSGRNKIAAALIALFLGVAGAHKFYLGNTRMGVIYILISLTAIGLVITAILSIYDFIMLLTMSDDDFAMKYQ